MAKYLNEHEVGFDPTCVGFPNLGDCMAAAVLTQNGLFGFHITPGQSKKAPTFLIYMQSNALAGNAVHLFGSCYWDRRYAGAASKESQWKTEMTDIANNIGYTGPVTGFDTSSWVAKIKATENSFVEYRKVGTKGLTFYKRMNKMDISDKALNNPNDKVQQIFSNKAVLNTYYVADPYLDKTTPSVSIKATDSNRGELHQAGYVGMHTFTV